MEWCCCRCVADVLQVCCYHVAVCVAGVLQCVLQRCGIEVLVCVCDVASRNRT